jgi:hypothetical protein
MLNVLKYVFFITVEPFRRLPACAVFANKSFLKSELCARDY